MSKFSLYGQGVITVLDIDSHSGISRLEVRMPCIMFQTISPQLLGAGEVSSYTVAEPFTVWSPHLSRDRLNHAASDVPDAEHKINDGINEYLRNLCKSAEILKGYLKNPSDVIPMLPMGIYVSFIYVVKHSGILNLIEGINNIAVEGIVDTQVAFAAALRHILSESKQYDDLRKRRLASRQT